MNDIKNEENLDLFFENYFSGKTIANIPIIDLRQKLNSFIACKMEQDFSGLVQLLYRLDVSENVIKQNLQQCPSDQASWIITDAICARMQQILESRNSFSLFIDPDKIPEDERWWYYNLSVT